MRSEEPTRLNLFGYALGVTLGAGTLVWALIDLDDLLDARKGELALIVAPFLLIICAIRLVRLLRRRRRD